MDFILVGIGGLFGAMSRYGIVLMISQLNPKAILPYGTMLVNITGCLAIGILAGIGSMKEGGLRPELRLLLMVGFLGGFTTFSSFGLEFFSLIKDLHPFRALIDVAIQVIAGFAAVGGGYWLGCILA